ncbi:MULTISPECIES: hypothetical protein [Microbacterium]|jgi:hypothetical protein|uniref:hypothetical protein n=1 Tax=Microbacterium TaxID=33882 RepID=UPI001D17D059|nr:hypothetical protein [Microbacterium testaceum]MCC4250176.1 hypothetical protein [Microbacterium testaceum]
MRRYIDDAPEGVVVYASAVDFTDEDRSRISGFGIPGDAGGYDAIEPVLHEDGSQWRVSVLDSTVYAVLRRHVHADRYTFAGPLWVIATLPAGHQYLSHHLRPSAAEYFRDLESRYRNKPDGLVDVVREIQAWAGTLSPVASVY